MTNQLIPLVLAPEVQANRQLPSHGMACSALLTVGRLSILNPSRGSAAGPFSRGSR